MRTGTGRCHPRARRHLAVPVAAVLAMPALLLVPAAPAAAHVIIESVEPRGDGTSRLTFTFDHGCEGGAPTDELRVSVPDGVDVLVAESPEGWSNESTADTVHWRGEPVPDGVRAEFILDVQVTGDVGQTFVFPTEQLCPSGGSYAWTDSEPSGARPAPRFVATTASLASESAPASPAASPIRTAPLSAGVVLASVAVGALGAWAVRRHHRTTS